MNHLSDNAMEPKHQKLESKIPITVLIATKNEAVNLPKCLDSLRCVERVVVIDSGSEDDSVEIAVRFGAEVVNFEYHGGYPKKRQWAIDNLSISTPWVFLLDADEVVPERLWNEIKIAICDDTSHDAFMIVKGFHFMKRRFQYGGFSFPAVLLFRTGKARFEKLFEDNEDSLDMEIHERVVVNGRIGRLKTPLIHEDFKGLEAYLARHNYYSTWESKLRYRYYISGEYGEDTIRPRIFGNSQERRRYLKAGIIRLPFEQWIWFFYHYIFRLGFLEGRPGLIASQIRSSYIMQVHAKIQELKANRNMN